MQELLQRVEDSVDEIADLKENLELLDFYVEQFMVVEPARFDEVFGNYVSDDSSKEQKSSQLRKF